MSLREQLNGGALDWAVRLVVGGAVTFIFIDGRGIHMQQSADSAHIAALQAKLDAVPSHVEIGIIRDEVSHVHAELEKKIDKEDVPPPEVIRWLQRIDARLDRLEERINSK